MHMQCGSKICFYIGVFMSPPFEKYVTGKPTLKPGCWFQKGNTGSCFETCRSVFPPTVEQLRVGELCCLKARPTTHTLGFQLMGVDFVSIQIE